MISSNIYLIIVIIFFYIFSDKVGHADFALVTETYIQFFSSETAYTTMDHQLKVVNAFLYDPTRKDMYVSEVFGNESSIYRINTSGKTAIDVIPIVAQQNVKGVAFDRLNSMLYWTSHDIIKRAQVPDGKTKELLKGDFLLKKSSEGFPSSIAIDVHGRYLYWANIAAGTNSTIERFHLDTSERKMLVEGLDNPRSLTVDEEQKTLYWLDWRIYGSRGIYSLDLVNVTAPTLFYAPDKSPLVIALDHLNVYWIHWSNKTNNELWSIPKKSSEHGTTLPIKVSKTDSSNYPIGLFMLSSGDVEEAGVRTVKNKQCVSD